MANPRRTSTRRAVLSYDQYKELYASIGIIMPELLVKDYQGILQDFISNADSIDEVDIRITENKADILEIQNSQFLNLASQLQDMQRQIDGLPELTIDTTGFTTDLTTITTDKVIA